MQPPDTLEGVINGQGGGRGHALKRHCLTSVTDQKPYNNNQNERKDAKNSAETRRSALISADILRHK